MGVSYLSRFVIVRHVAERMGHNTTGRECKPRVFIMGFPGLKKQASLDDLNSEKYYNWWAAHRNGVVGNEALVLDSAERYASVNFYGLNPGVISTNIMSGLIGNGSFFLRMQQYITRLIFQSAEQYAENMVPLLVSPDIEAHSGFMFGPYANPIYSNPILSDKSYWRKLIEESEKLVKKALL